MSEFKYRTRIGDSLRGRQKLYFCCHPDDLVDRKERVKYLEEARDIWQQLYIETGITELGLRAGTMTGHIKKLKPFRLW